MLQGFIFRNYFGSGFVTCKWTGDQDFFFLFVCLKMTGGDSYNWQLESVQVGAG